MRCCDIFERWKIEENLLRMYSCWTLAVRTKQATLGSCVIMLNRHAEDFSEISEVEMTELLEVIKNLERALKNAFRCDIINYLVLRGHDKHFHIHVLPRYASGREFEGRLWEDKVFPDVIKEELRPPPATAATTEAVKNEIQKNF